MANDTLVKEFERELPAVDGATVTVTAPTPAPNEPAPILITLDNNVGMWELGGYAATYLTKDQARAVAQALLQACEEAP